MVCLLATCMYQNGTFFQVRNNQLSNRGRTDSTTSVTMTVSFYYTDDFAAVTSDPEAEINQYVANANAGYANSELPIRLEAFCIKEIPFEEREDVVGMVKEFAVSMGSYEATRNTADTAFLVLSKSYSGTCGIATIGAHQPTVQPFGWIAKGCQLVVTGHEIGHNFGCLHNKEIQAGKKPPSFFEGFEYGNLIDDPQDGTPTGYATIMR